MSVSNITKQKVITDIQMNESNIQHNEFKEKNLGRGFWLAVVGLVVGLAFNALPKLIEALHTAGIIGS
jgi:hypothetical protein